MKWIFSVSGFPEVLFDDGFATERHAEWKMVYNTLDKNRENREKMLLTFAKNSIRSKAPPSFRAILS